MRTVHAAIGFAIVAAFAVLFLWGILGWILRKGPGRGFWPLLAGVQIALLVQLVAGVILLAAGGREGILHYSYGVLMPALVLAVAHVLAREAFSDRPWLPFAWAAFFCFGLTLRALMTGLGIG